MTARIIFFGSILLLGTWFLIDDRSSVKDKIAVLCVGVFLYAFVMMMQGAKSFREMLEPILHFLRNL